MEGRRVRGGGKEGGEKRGKEEEGEKKKKKTIAKNNINSGTEPFSHLQLQHSRLNLLSVKSNSLPLELLSLPDQIQQQIRNTFSGDSRGGDLREGGGGG